jgi:50S ribosome-binding GTPase
MTEGQGLTDASVSPSGTGAAPDPASEPDTSQPAADTSAQVQPESGGPSAGDSAPGTAPEADQPATADATGEGPADESGAGQPAAGQLDEGQLDEGQLDEGQLDEGQPDEGQLDEGQPDEGQLDEEPELHVRVDGRKLESALLALRHPIVEVPLRLEAPGATEARAERRKLLSQIDDYLLPRLRQSGAPVLVAVVGSTGAGKSTLINSLVGKQVSLTGTRRPTTNSPVLACHTGEARWFAENVFLPTLPRVRQKGLAMPGRDGLLVLAESDGVPEGVALLDTPDIDSVVKAHREFAHQFLDASDLWLFMTSASRYADAAVWELLQQAKERDASLAIVLSRVQPAAQQQLTAHFDSMLEVNGLGQVERFTIPETVVTDGMLPAEVVGPVRQWLEETASRQERRIAVLTKTMSGVLDTFRTRVPALADHVEKQLTLRSELLAQIDGCYAAALAEFDETTRNGSLLRGEILARWQDFASAGDLLRMLQVRRGNARPATRTRKRRIPPARAMALKAAVRAALEALVAALADRAAEDTVARWEQQEAGAALVAGVAADDAASQADNKIELDLVAGLDFIPAPGHGSPEPRLTGAAALTKSSPELATWATRAISGWQDHVLQLVQAENVTKRSVARVVSFDEESLALVLTISVLGGDAAATAEAETGAPDNGTAESTGALPQRLLTSLLGAGPLRELSAKARQDLHDRVRLLFEEDMLRFAQVVAAAGAPDDTTVLQLHQASYALEAAR